MKIIRPRPVTQGFTIATRRGRELEYGLQSDEERFEKWKESTRHPLWKAALNAAMEHKHEFSRRLVKKEGISLDLWPEMAPLTGQERTLMIATLQDMWDLPYDCACVNAPASHLPGCSPFKPMVE